MIMWLKIVVLWVIAYMLCLMLWWMMIGNPYDAAEPPTPDYLAFAFLPPFAFLVVVFAGEFL